MLCTQRKKTTKWQLLKEDGFRKGCHPSDNVSGDPQSEAGEGQAASENSSGDESKLAPGTKNKRVELERYCVCP